MKQNAVFGTRRTTFHTGDAMMKTPSRDPGDFCIAYGAEATLQIPEKAKCSSTPERFRHMISFAFLEVGLIGRVVRVSFAFDLNVSLDGCAIREPQPHFVWCAFLVASIPKEAPVVKSLAPKVFLFEPSSR